MKTNISEEKFSKIKKFRIKIKNIDSKKKTMQNKTKFKTKTL